MIVLDTNVVSELMRSDPLERVITWTDAQIAATCRSHGATIATRNVDDFSDAGIVMVDPWSID